MSMSGGDYMVEDINTKEGTEGKSEEWMVKHSNLSRREKAHLILDERYRDRNSKYARMAVDTYVAELEAEISRMEVHNQEWAQRYRELEAKYNLQLAAWEKDGRKIGELASRCNSLQQELDDLYMGKRRVYMVPASASEDIQKAIAVSEAGEHEPSEKEADGK